MEQGSVLRLNEKQRRGQFPSQSLWNRAVSYDRIRFLDKAEGWFVSIPLEQGSVLRLILFHWLGVAGSVSIPLEQGSVLRQQRSYLLEIYI